MSQNIFKPEKLLEFFGLNQQPFGLTPNTSLYYGLPTHEEALEVLNSALNNGEGFIKVTGEVGTGKTMVLRLFISNLADSYELVYLPNPILNPGELKISIARELSLDVSNCTNLSLNDDINHCLLELNKKGKRVVLVIDEAQALPDDTIEAIRLLGNLETEHNKMLQIILFGQPELDERLNCEHLRQLKQRITFSYKLRPLDKDETFAYLNYRMQAAGFKGSAVFSKRISDCIFKHSGGIPRLVNVIAAKCIMLAYGQGTYNVTKRFVLDSVSETESVSVLQANIWNILLSISIVLLFALTVYLFFWG